MSTHIESAISAPDGNKAILIDTENWKILKIHRDPLCLLYWQHILIPHSGNAIRGCEKSDFDIFTRSQLIQMLDDLTGETSRPNRSRADLIRDLVMYIEREDEDTTPLNDLKKQYGKELPKIVLEEDKPRPTKRRKSAATGELKRPAEGTTTRQVWDLADQVYQEHIGEDWPRVEIIRVCTDHGIHPSTAATQYSKWKRFNDNKET
jgi:hypothetical protein